MSSLIKNLAVGIILIGVMYLGYTMFFVADNASLAIDNGSNEGAMLASEFLVRLNELQAINFSRELFDDPRFRSLTSFSTVPDTVSSGRPDPFSR